MDVQELLTLGILIDPGTLKFIEDLPEEKKHNLLELLQKMEEKPLVLDKSAINDLLTPPRVIRTFEKRGGDISVHDIVSSLSRRYDVLQKVLIKKIDLRNPVSIGSCQGGYASIIGLVKEKKEKPGRIEVELEDPTGTITAVFSGALMERARTISNDEVIGVRGKASREAIEAEKLLWPDLTFRQPKTAQAAITVSADNGFVLRQGPNEIRTNGAFVDVNGVVILLHAGKYEELAVRLGIPEDKVPLELLKRRTLLFDSEVDVIDPVPDIFLTKTKNRVTENYKGVTIIGIPGGSVTIDLESREAQKTT